MGKKVSPASLTHNLERIDTSLDVCCSRLMNLSFFAFIKEEAQEHEYEEEESAGHC